MKIGDLVKRTDPILNSHVYGIVVGFDQDEDPIILWNDGNIEEEYASEVSVIIRPLTSS